MSVIRNLAKELADKLVTVEGISKANYIVRVGTVGVGGRVKRLLAEQYRRDLSQAIQGSIREALETAKQAPNIDELLGEEPKDEFEI